MLNLQFKTVSSRRHGLTLIEVMIAMVMTLVVLGAMMAAFSYGSTEMQKGRASIELNNRLVAAEEQLRRDLDRITVELKPHHQLPALPKGYVEIIDGAQTDYVPGNDTTFSHGGNELVFGDRDDFFACTIKSEGRAFRGRRQYGANNDLIESHLAEVVWFTVTVFDPNTSDPIDVLTIRRQMLILPSLGVVGVATDYDTFVRENDISVRIEGGSLVANSLTDLAIRGNRFSHANTGLPGSSDLQTVALGDRYNENHIMFSSVAAFDVQVFDSNAYVRQILPDGEIVEPFDIGSRNSNVANRVGTFARLGAYVDLGKGINLAAADAGILGRAPTLPYAGEAVFDTGTSIYNRDASNDFGTNGVDDNGDGIVDDINEQDSIAPYNTPIRGLKFTMRALEPTTNQVRQLSVTKSFVAE